MCIIYWLSTTITWSASTMNLLTYSPLLIKNWKSQSSGNKLYHTIIINFIISLNPLSRYTYLVAVVWVSSITLIEKQCLNRELNGKLFCLIRQIWICPSKQFAGTNLNQASIQCFILVNIRVAYTSQLETNSCHFKVNNTMMMSLDYQTEISAAKFLILFFFFYQN